MPTTVTTTMASRGWLKHTLPAARAPPSAPLLAPAAKLPCSLLLMRLLPAAPALGLPALLRADTPLHPRVRRAVLPQQALHLSVILPMA